jgi:hypothetical protein
MNKLFEDCFALALLLLAQSALTSALLERLSSATASAGTTVAVAVLLVFNFLLTVARIHMLFEEAGRR